METIKKYYKFIKERPTLFNGAHSIFTPQELVEDALGKVNLHGNILVMFNVEFALSLVYTYNVTPKNITFLSDHENKNKICDQLGIKYITQLDPNMNFDVVLANPPYNNVVGDNRQEAKNTNNSNLYFDFIKKAIDITTNGVVVMITPAAWMQNDEMKKLILGAGLESINWVDPAHFPGVGIRSGISLFKATTGYNGNITIRKESAVYSVPRNGTLSFDDPTKFNIVDKIKNTATIDTKLKYGPYTIPKGSKGSFSRLLALDSSFSEVPTKEHNTKVMIYAGGTREPARYLYHKINQTSTKYGVAIPSASDKHVLGAARIINPGEGVSDRLKVVYFDTLDQANNCINYLGSSLIRFVINTTKHNDTVNTNKNSFGNIPFVDFTQAWTDQSLYQHFDLTQDEINYVESHAN